MHRNTHDARVPVHFIRAIMNTVLESVIDDIRGRFGDAVEDVYEFRDDVCVVVRKDAIADVALFLRDNERCPFPLCEDVLGIDQFTRTNRFEVKYHFFSLLHKVRLHLKVKIDEKDLTVPTITGVYPGANWYEREAYDMYGMVFSGHPDLRRAYMPEDYQYHPLRKDFPMMGIPGSIPLPKR